MSTERRIFNQTERGQRVRIVTKWFGEESWWHYYIFYRPLQAKLRDLLYKYVTRPHGGDPGSSFTGEPFLYRRTRKAIVLAQRGGWDI